MFVSDLRHFLDMPADVPAPARRMADHLTLIVRAATAGDAGQPWVTALACSRRPGRRPCPGHIEVVRVEVPSSIQWRCVSCGDDGVISGWEGTPFDLTRSSHRQDGVGTPVRLVITSDTASVLRGLLLLDAATERLIFRARMDGREVILIGHEDTFDELLDSIAADGNHEENGRRRKRLDAAFDALSEALDYAHATGQGPRPQKR